MNNWAAKTAYLDLMERAFQAYSIKKLRDRICDNGDRLDLQCYSRLTNVLACLLAAGRLANLFELWLQMMTESCRELPQLRDRFIADFAVKEIMLAYRWMAPNVSEELKQEWRSQLKQMDPYLHYGWVIRQAGDEDKLHNISIYNMAGEFLRELEGLTDTKAYFDAHWPIQLTRFDRNGMYRDPGCPMLYDLTTRCQIQILLGCGYRGAYADELDENLRKAGLMTLHMQSAAFEMPYGGRSNQFLFNEALIAANCEYEAVRYKKLGDLGMAGAFKRCGRLAVQAIGRWLDDNPPRHIKNGYSIESGYGAEYYGFYDKYMITFGAFLTIAYMFADDTIAEAPCPAEVGGYVLETSESFHKIFANAGGYSLEIDTQADPHYDASGLGRIHRAGFPGELALSHPLCGETSYMLHGNVQRTWAAISPGWKSPDAEIQFLSALGSHLDHRLTVIEQNEQTTKFLMEYSGTDLCGCEGLKESYSLDKNGLSYAMELVNPCEPYAYLQLPLLLTNGKQQTQISVKDNLIRVTMDNQAYEIKFKGEVVIDWQTRYGNRNGEYALATLACKGNRLTAEFGLITLSTC